VTDRVLRMDRPAIQGRVRKFVQEYCKDFDRKRAGMAVGYTEASANKTAGRLLRQPAVRRAIARLLDKRAARLEVTIDRAITELGKIGFADITDFVDLEADDPIRPMADWDRTKSGAVSSIEVFDKYDAEGRRVGRTSKLKMHDKTGALALILKQLGGLVDRHEVKGEIEHRHTVENARTNMNRMLQELAKRLSPPPVTIEAAPVPQEAPAEQGEE
jgi:phage terminase small subunit